jgi:hypothetical protein
MKKSAMSQAFKALGRKPLVFLLILPVPLAGILHVCFMPDLSKLMDLNNAVYNMEYYPDFQFFADQMRSIVVGSLASVISLAGIFLLLPPAVELLRDGAAGTETPRGWFARGIVNHWWKPAVTSVITGAAYFVVSIPAAIVMCVSIFMRSFTLTGDFYFSSYMSPNDAVNTVMNTLFPDLLWQIVIFGAVFGVLALVAYSLFGLMLPALADRKFGAAFKLMFGRKGFRNLPRMAGGLLLLYVVPQAVFVGFGALYVMTAGVPGDYMGWILALYSFIRSWAGLLAFVISALFIVLTYAFKFCVYQQIKEEEAAQPELQP